MVRTTKKILGLLGAGEPIAAVCAAAGWSREQFDAWWCAECRRRVPAANGALRLRGVRGRVRIRRDRWGVPHVTADRDADLFFGFGYATAQDRLFQIDYLRRQARGRLAEVLGPDGLASDRLYRTLNLAGAAEAEWRTLPVEACNLLVAYAAGVNSLIEGSRGRLPIEFDLLGYRPGPWSPVDSLAVMAQFCWELTAWLPVLVAAELARRALGDGPLYRAFLRGEVDDESILPPGSYAPGPRRRAGETVSSQDEGFGSNGLVLAGARTTSGKPLLANDPHVPLAAVSMWHEMHLRGGSFHVAGAAYAGVPAVLAGRTERVAWGFTSNLCSLRDLYQEQTDPGHPGCFLYDGRWEPASERREVIAVKGAAPEVLTVRSSRNGPVVDDLLPGPARGTGPVSLRWLGAEPCGWLPALLGMNGARSAEELREATRPWRAPTLNLVFADVDGHTGHQCAGRIPVRRTDERGYRPGWDPAHQWQGEVPFEGMPRQTDPPKGFVVTANNRLAPDDYPHPLAGMWWSGHRARRIRRCLEARRRWSAADCRRLQQDVRSGRAAACVPRLVALLAGDDDSRVRETVALLRAWDYRAELDSVGASLFNAFFLHWCRAVAAERLPGGTAALAAPNAAGLAAALLYGRGAGWFPRGARRQAVRAALVAALDDLTARLGPAPGAWTWGRLHTLVLRHFLSGRGDLGSLLDRGGVSARGDGTTVCNTRPDASFTAFIGPSYRMVADLADPRQGLWAVSLPGTSGHPGSPHDDDQIAPWGLGGYHYLPLNGPEAAGEWDLLVLEPASSRSAVTACA
jgi:penicillin amidase